MSKQQPVQLLSSGSIVPELLYGPFARDWWTLRTHKELNGGSPRLYPIRIGMKTSTRINTKEFIIRVVQQVKDNKTIPGYVCQTGQDSGNVENDSSAAITNLYQTVFSNTTKLSGPLMMGLENKDILNEITTDLVFQPVIFSLGRLRIMVHTIGISRREDWHWAGPGYTASLVHGNDRLLYLQGFDKDKCYIEVYTAKGLLVTTVYGENPNDAWKNLSVLKNYNGMQ